MKTKPISPRLSVHVTVVLALLCVASISQRAWSQASSIGQWSAVQTWPIVSVHTHVLPTGKVMFYPYGDDARLWNPADNSITTLPRAGYNIFCTGHSFIADGRLLVTGGHVQNG